MGQLDDQPEKKPAKEYGKFSKKQWLLIYIVAAVIVYGLIYLIFIHKSGTSPSSGSGY